MFSTDATTLGLTTIVHTSNNAVFFFPNIFDPWLVKSVDAEPADMKD